jgi:hypothetical protein
MQARGRVLQQFPQRGMNVFILDKVIVIEDEN